jgi:hypothetical protein
MSNHEIVPSDDGFGDDSGSDRLLQGSRVLCVDGDWTFAKDDAAVPGDKRFLVLSTAEAQQHWQDGHLVEERIKKPGMQFAETVDELNAKIPQEEWEEGLNGPRPPWAHVYAVYLLDPADGAIYTAMNSTTGMAAAVREIKSQVKWMRALRGDTVNPVVTLGRRLHSKKWKKLGPSFIVVEWRNFGPEPQSPALPAPPADLLGVKVEEPSLSEQMNDEMPPWNDDPGIDTPSPPAPPDKKALVSNLRKSAEPQKPHTTKRGVTKIAGGRGR